MNPLLPYLSGVFHPGIVYAPNHWIRIDNRGPVDVSPEYCFITAVECDDPECYGLRLYPMPDDTEVREYLTSFDVEVRTLTGGLMVNLRMENNDSDSIRGLAIQIRRITWSNQNCPDRIWTWICRSTADSLDRLADHLDEYKQLETNGQLPDIDPDEGLYV